MNIPEFSLLCNSTFSDISLIPLFNTLNDVSSAWGYEGVELLHLGLKQDLITPTSSVVFKYILDLLLLYVYTSVLVIAFDFPNPYKLAYDWISYSNEEKRGRRR